MIYVCWNWFHRMMMAPRFSSQKEERVAQDAVKRFWG
jgi:hypothetical protein